MAKPTLFKKNDLVPLKIESLTDLGFGVAKVDGMVTFVGGAIPGDEVAAKIIKVTPSYAVAIAESFTVRSPLRVTDRCALACKSCAYKEISYAEECRLKEDGVREDFIKAGLSDVKVLPLISSPKVCGYRNKAQYPIALLQGGSYRIGFFAPKSHRVTEASGCPLALAVFSEILEALRAFFREKQTTVYNEADGKGLLRHIYLRRGEVSGEILLTLVVNGRSIPCEEELVSELVGRFPAIVGILLNENREDTNVILGKTYRTLYGRNFIHDTLAGVTLRLEAPAFYQVNHDCAELLYAKAKELAAPKDGEVLLDLFCGVGSIGLSMAKEVKEVIGIEIVPEAIACAKENARENGIGNARFYVGDAAEAERLLAGAEEERGEKILPDTVILDPPRAGCDEKLVRFVSSLSPAKIVYISCNPKTLARDCVLFRALGYGVSDVTPVDMFPGTGHVESVCLLTRASATHNMKLNPEPFEMIKSGKKTIELRLFDEKRQKIKVGDRIVFSEAVTGEKLIVKVEKLHRFAGFADLYQTLPLLKCGYTEENVSDAKPSDMEEFYSAEEQRNYGVVGIEIILFSEKDGESAC